MSEFGEYIRKKRLANKLTLREFCLKNGYDVGNHSKLERGLLLPPEGEKLDRLIEALGIGLTKPKNCFDTQELGEYYTLKELAEVERQPLLKKIQTLEAKVKEKEDVIKSLEEYWYKKYKLLDRAHGNRCEEVSGLFDKNQTLQKENSKLRECVEFYADRKNWNYDYFNGHDDYNDSEMEACGKKARETLKELESGE